MPKVLILGSTDVTIAVAEATLAAGLPLAGIVTVESAFTISYSKTPVVNARHAPVGEWCARNGVETCVFDSYDGVAARYCSSDVAVCLVAGWYHMVPRRFRERFRFGCLGFHASLLPKLRGGAPLNWAILAGLPETGVSLFALGDGVDDGLVFAQARFPIGPRTEVGDLVAASRMACADLTRRHVPDVLAGHLAGRKQEGMASYALQRTPEDGRIDWTRSAREIDRLVRAVGRPYPGAFTSLWGKKIIIWRSDVLEAEPVVLGAPGQIARLPGLDVPCVVTGSGIIAIRDASSESGDALDELRKAAQARLVD